MTATPDAGKDNAGQTAKMPNRQVLKAIVIKPTAEDIAKAGVDDVGRSKALPTDDYLENLITSGKIIPPPFDPLMLATLREYSTMLGPCINAMEINCDGFGWKLTSKVQTDRPDIPKQLADAVAAERVMLTNVLNNVSADDTLTDIRRKTRVDIESTGNGYWEIIRGPKNGKIQKIRHIPSYQMRLGAQDMDWTEYQRNVLLLDPDGSQRLEKDDDFKCFRRFVQTRFGTITASMSEARGYRVRWFKEYGDPRPIDSETGEVVTADKLADFDKRKLANEILHWKIYSERTPYGVPRFIGCLLTIYGDRSADEINFVTMRNNNIPSMLLMCANGQFTEATIQRIQEFVDTQIQGSANYSRFLILEAEGQFEGEDPGNIKIQATPLKDSQIQDQMFQVYGKNNGSKIRRAFRLAPVFTGDVEEYSKGNVEASRRMTDEQVFRPDRNSFDDKFNMTIMADLGAVYHRFVSNGPNVTDDEDLIKVLMAAERTGGLTPRIARDIIQDIMGRELPEIDPAKLDPDTPFSIQIAERVKNQAAQTTGSPEIGSQVTALKSMDAETRSALLLKTLLYGQDAIEKDLNDLMFKRQ